MQVPYKPTDLLVWDIAVADKTKDHDLIARRIHRMFWIYLSAIGLLFISVAASVVLTEYEAIQISSDAHLINKSGRQRMLSQRIIYLAADYQAAPAERQAETGAALARAIDTFEAAITLFETSHADMLIASEGMPDVETLYFGLPSDTKETLDDRVRAYISFARQVLADPSDRIALEQLRQIEQAGLLGELDKIVTAFENASKARVALLRQVELYSLIFALFIIIFEVIFVFQPGHKLLQRSFNDLSTRNKELDDAQVTLTAAHGALKIRADMIEAERAKLNIALQDSESLRKEQAAFSYAVSHELKSPTNTIHLLLNEIDFHTSDSTDEELRELLLHTQTATERMRVLIHDTLEYSWVTQNICETETVDMKQCVASAIANLETHIQQCGAVITSEQLQPATGDARQLRILVQNLLSNAITYCADGVVPRITISCVHAASGHGSVLCVSDNGIGVAPDDQDRIFDLFSRLHLQGAYPGSGLGLATCNRVALNHAGHISLTSNLGKGSIFSVALNTPLPTTLTQQKDLAA